MKDEKKINILLELIGNELNYEEDYNSDDKEYIKDLLETKIWLMKKKKLLPIIINQIEEEDKKRYLKEGE